MYLIYIGFYVILALFQGGFTQIYEEGQNVEFECVHAASGSLVFWLRMNRGSPEFILTTKNTDEKVNANKEKYTFVKEKQILVVQSFNKTTDSGTYTCAAMNNNKLSFGKVYNIMGRPDPTKPPIKNAPAPTTAKRDIVITTTKCACKKEAQSVLNCETWILSSLASGCGLLLLLLVITIVYCNRLRTRRCPHHYKRQPPTRPAGHAKQPNNHF